MRLVPRSLFGRLFLSAGLFIAIALMIAGLSIGQVLERFVMQGLDQRLDAQIALLVRVVRPDGSLDSGKAIDMPPFDRAGSGWAWQIVTPRQTLRSASLEGATMPLPDLRPHWRPRRNEPGIEPADGRTAAGEGLHFRVLQIASPAGPVTISASAPRAVVERPLQQALGPLALSLVILGAVLIAAILLQLRFGLRPLRRLEDALIAVRAGQTRHVPEDQPYELRSLVGQLNGLIDQNEAGLENARRHVANLAHGLKTPLAALQVRLAENGQDHDGEMTRLVKRIDTSIRHHLGRARAVAPGGPARKNTALGSHVADLVDTLGRIHAGRQVTAHVAMAADLAVRCDPQDLDEMLGNLVDNAWRWAAATVTIDARAIGSNIVCTITDDGPGLGEDQRDDALVAGLRMDERPDGHGFGLSITQELAELYGGSLQLGAGSSGGLAVRLTLPAGEVDRYR